jgi:hypothetical protein
MGLQKHRQTQRASEAPEMTRTVPIEIEISAFRVDRWCADVSNLLYPFPKRRSLNT